MLDKMNVEVSKYKQTLAKLIALDKMIGKASTDEEWEDMESTVNFCESFIPGCMAWGIDNKKILTPKQQARIESIYEDFDLREWFDEETSYENYITDRRLIDVK